MIKQKLIEYLDLTIQTKKNMKKRIYQLETELKESHKNENDAIEQMNKYKASNIKLRRKLKEKNNG